MYVRPEVTQQFMFVHTRTGSEERTTFDMVKYPTPHFNKFENGIASKSILHEILYTGCLSY